MWLPLVVVVFLGTLVLLFLFVCRRHAPVHLTREQVAAAFANALDLDTAGNHDEFDLFLGRPIADPELETLRKQCLAVIEGDSKPVPGRDLGPGAEQWLRERLAELRRTGAQYDT
jgi:hypothetical protein